MTRKLTKEEFITRANKIHNNLYDYSKVEYKGNKIRVCIVDPDHGEFWQRPNEHLDGCGSPARKYATLSKKHMLTTNEFIQKSKNKYGDKYDYSKVNYTGSRNKVILIIKNTKKEISVTPHDHLREKRDCSKTKNKISFKDEFIKKANNKFGSRFDYSKIEYVNRNTKIEIYDTLRKEYFCCLPKTHLNSGNPNDGKEKSIEKRSLTTEEFIEKSIAFHGENIFDYSKVEYINFHTPVIFIHIESGMEYKQSPSTHLKEKTIPNTGNRRDYDIDHIIPISIISSIKDRNKFKDRPLMILLNDSKNLKKMNSTNNRNKSDKIFINDSIESARKYRNNYEIIKILLLQIYENDFINKIIETDKLWMGQFNELFR